MRLLLLLLLSLLYCHCSAITQSAHYHAAAVWRDRVRVSGDQRRAGRYRVWTRPLATYCLRDYDDISVHLLSDNNFRVMSVHSLGLAACVAASVIQYQFLIDTYRHHTVTVSLCSPSICLCVGGAVISSHLRST